MAPAFFNRLSALFRSFVLLFLCACISLPLTASTDTLTVGVYQNPPKVFITEQNTAAGIFIDLLREIARLEGWQLRYMPDSWTNCLDAARNGRIDIMPDVAFSAQRETALDFNKVPVLESWSQLFVRRSTNISRLADLENKRVALLQGSIQQDLFDQKMKGFGYAYTFVPAQSFREAFLFVRTRRADAVIANYFFGESHYKTFRLKKTPLVFSPASLHFASGTGRNAEILGTIDRYMKTWKENPNSYYYRTVRDYIEKPLYEYDDGSYVVFYILTILIILLLIAGLLTAFRKLRLRATKLQQSHTRLKEEENKFRNYINHSPIGIYLSDENGKCMDVNPAACTITGYSRKELLSLNIDDLIPEEARKDASAHFDRVLNNKKASDVFPLQRKDGQLCYWKVQSVRISDSRILGFATDISEQKRQDDELKKIKGNLEDTVRKRTAELNNKVRELDKSQKAMLYMVEDLNETTAELKSERQKLEVSNQELEAFTYSVSHDLRAPLRAINGYSRFLLEDYADRLDKEGRRFINTISENAAKMDSLITDLLNLSRVSRTELRICDTDMAKIASAIYQEIATESEKKAFTLKIPEMPRVKCDPTLIKQVWQNLLSNALKYSERSETKIITVACDTQNDDYVFSVRDRGAGFNSKYAHKIFEIFQRLHRENEFEGTGVGLAVVKRIITRHGGKVWAESEPGKGAVFYFSLPKQ